MEYDIIGFPDYKVNDERQIIKITQTVKGRKVSIVSAVRPRKDCEYEYVRLSKKENGKTIRYNFPVDEIFVSAKLGIKLGTPESRQQLKKFRYEKNLMGKVSAVVGDPIQEQELVNILHADIVRQMNSIGLNVGVDNLTAFVVSQLLFDYLRICKDASKVPQTINLKTKYGETMQDHPLWTLKLKIYDRLVTGFRALGLTFERVIKQLPQEVFKGISSDIFENKEREDKIKSLGITWNEA